MKEKRNTDNRLNGGLNKPVKCVCERESVFSVSSLITLLATSLCDMNLRCVQTVRIN